MVSTFVQYRRVSSATVKTALARGWQNFSAERNISVTYALMFALIGLSMFVLIEHFSLTPMILPLAGGFMLVGPVLLTGFFSLADRIEAKQPVHLSDVADGFRRSPRGLWIVALVCALLFMIWVSDAATLYGFMVGRLPMSLLDLLPPPENVVSFALWSSIMGAVLAFLIFAVSAFSVPLLYYRRTDLVPAVVASVRAIFGNFFVVIPWAILLSASIIGSILLLPLFPIVFPVLAYASHAFYRELFPDTPV